MRVVSFAAYSGEPSEELIDKARRFLEELARCSPRPVLAFGGYWGLMRVMVDEALRLGFTVLIFPPIEREDWGFPSEAIVVRSGMGFRLRSIALVRTGDVLVAMGGGSGTMQEVVTAYAEGKDVFLLAPTGLPSDRLAEMAPYLDTRRLAEIRVYSDPIGMTRAVCRAVGGAVN